MFLKIDKSIKIVKTIFSFNKQSKSSYPRKNDRETKFDYQQYFAGVEEDSKLVGLFGADRRKQTIEKQFI